MVFAYSLKLLHLQLQSGKHAKLAVPHLQFVQSSLQEHLISLLHALTHQELSSKLAAMTV